jgi:hypothetical protein
MPAGRAISEPDRNPQLGFEVVDRIVFDDRYAYFDIGAHPIREIAADRCVKRKEKLAGLAGGGGSGVYPDIVARVHGEEPALRQTNVEGGSNLRLIDCRLRGVVGKLNAQRNTGTK